MPRPDIGEALNSSPILRPLERTRVGDVRLEDCLDPMDFKEWIDVQGDRNRKNNLKERIDMKLSQFKFKLPEEEDCFAPYKYRRESRLMVLHIKTGEIEHKRIQRRFELL